MMTRIFNFKKNCKQRKIKIGCSQLAFYIFLLTLSGFAQSLPLYKNPKLPVNQRVKDLLSRMTQEEKFWQLFMIPGDLDHQDSSLYKTGIFGFQVSAGSADGAAAQQMLSYNREEDAITLAKKINAIQKYFVEKTRLGIPIIAFDETLHGLVRAGATAFPQSIALAATWNTRLMGSVANAIAIETKQRGIRQILSPVINIAADPRWGRTEETYGEDPFLTSEMGVAYIAAFEKLNIITTPKHFIANVGDAGRDSYPIHTNERLLDEIYLAPFKAVVQRAGARSIMTSYNSLDGTPNSSNAWLLKKKLKGDWKFSGFVITDAGATGGANVLHFTAKDYPESAAQAINNGLDVMFQTAREHYKLFIPHFMDGGIAQKNIDEAVSRVLKAKFELGLFEHPYVEVQEDGNGEATRQHREIARSAAIESIVLLKNEQEVLPIQPRVQSIAVLGEEAVAARLGGYSGPGNGKINILDGIKQRAGKGIQVAYAPGAGIAAAEWIPVPDSCFSTIKDGQSVKGLTGNYFDNILLSGDPVLTRIDPAINFQWTLFAPAPELQPDFYAVRWTGQLRATQSGWHKIGLDGNDGFRLYINDSIVIDHWKKQSYTTQLVDYLFQQDQQYRIKVEFFEPVGNAHIHLIWDIGITSNWQSAIEEAVALAKKSDLAIVVAGIHEGEFQDRAYLNLPGHQEALIASVAATGKPVVVLLVGGSAITMSNWLPKVQAVADCWYPGEAGGSAVASILFGDENPAGRLPVAFPIHESQLPYTYNHKPTGRGDDYYNLTGLPLFPFGFGLSYTTFKYEDLSFEKNNIGTKESTKVRFKLTNTGNRDGDEVVQLYIRDLLASVARPVMELKGFQRIHLKAGASTKVEFALTPAMLSMLNQQLKTVVEPGDFRIMIGASSMDIRLKANLKVHK